MTTFAENLFKLRKSHDLSLKELSDRLNNKYELKRFTCWKATNDGSALKRRITQWRRY